MIILNKLCKEYSLYVLCIPGRGSTTFNSSCYTTAYINPKGWISVGNVSDGLVVDSYDLLGFMENFKKIKFDKEAALVDITQEVLNFTNKKLVSVKDAFNYLDSITNLPGHLHRTFLLENKL